MELYDPYEPYILAVGLVVVVVSVRGRVEFGELISFLQI